MKLFYDISVPAGFVVNSDRKPKKLFRKSLVRVGPTKAEIRMLNPLVWLVLNFFCLNLEDKKVQLFV